MEIIPGVFRIKNPIVNWYLIAEDSGLALIDAGTSSAYKPVIELIGRLGREITELQYILLTHADLDHVGAAMRLKSDSGAKIYASQIAADALADGHSSRSLKVGVLTPLFNWFERQGGAMQVTVDQVVAEGQSLPILGGLHVIETPGHTPCHLAYYAVEEKLLFAGDAVRTVPGQVNYNQKKITNWDHEIMKKSVDKLAELEPEIVCCGHGPVLFNAARKFPH
jgi:glyoxylase-like metal-dependent hydrolase (beta-lactamase superfamily II)